MKRPEIRPGFLTLLFCLKPLSVLNFVEPVFERARHFNANETGSETNVYLRVVCLYMNFGSSKRKVMLSPENLKKILPGIVTRVAINYPIAYINSVSFIVKNKMVAACFWNEKKNSSALPSSFALGSDSKSGCFIFHATDEIHNSEIEITGTDERGNDFIVSLPYHHLINYRLAS